jgi:hypothetical protein
MFGFRKAALHKEKQKRKGIGDNMVEFKRMTTNRAIEIVKEFGYESTTAYITPEDANKIKEMYPDNVYTVYREEDNFGWISFLNKSGEVLEYEVKREEETEETEETEFIEFVEDNGNGNVEYVDVFESIECGENKECIFECIEGNELLGKYSGLGEKKTVISEKRYQIGETVTFICDPYRVWKCIG